jgi:hypothetical protein
MSKNICQLIESRRIGHEVHPYLLVKKVVDSRLACTSCSDYGKKLLKPLNKFMKEIYEDNQYMKVRDIFETKVEDYLYQANEYVETFIEELAEDIFFRRQKKLIGFTDIPGSIYEINRAALENKGIKMTVLDDWDAVC